MKNDSAFWWFLLLVLFLLATSCSKENIKIVQHWKVKVGRDTTTRNHAAFCFASDSVGIDTVEMVFYKRFDPAKFSYDVGDIYFFPKTGYIPTAIDGIYVRNYCKLLERID